jgi:hypothetical protein
VATELGRWGSGQFGSDRSWSGMNASRRLMFLAGTVDAVPAHNRVTAAGGLFSFWECDEAGIVTQQSRGRQRLAAGMEDRSAGFVAIEVSQKWIARG